VSPTISGGKVLDTCGKCGKYVQINKRLGGSLHFCITDCQKVGRHLDVREETRGWLWKRAWVVCRRCGLEAKRVSPQASTPRS
jgi:hypothetical protein